MNPTARLWLCSDPWPADSLVPSFPPDEDRDGEAITSRQPITAFEAASIRVQNYQDTYSHGDEFEVWVWRPREATKALCILVKVAVATTYTTRPKPN